MLERLKAALSRAVKETVSRISQVELTERNLTEALEGLEMEYLSLGIPLSTIEALKASLLSKLSGRKVSRFTDLTQVVKSALREVLLDTLNLPRIDLLSMIREAPSPPFVMLFLGYNGAGKSLTLCKVAVLLRSYGLRVLAAAGDTFRAGAIDQLVGYCKQAGIPCIESERGSDSCAVIFQAVKAAEKRKYDVVLADTAGRTHADVNLMDELRKIVRVIEPDLKVLVVDAVLGEDVINQCREFDSKVGIDAVIVTKLDAVDTPAAVLSVAVSVRKPILYLGTGQNINDLMPYDPEKLLGILIP
ncbi:MAG: signal recognition particle-docking protein FtsY [Thermoproteota archaeon]|nr:MAG: signal recognition particle-docking protein FtsY [Candidatus Korarchaeota archaeon]